MKLTFIAPTTSLLRNGEPIAFPEAGGFQFQQTFKEKNEIIGDEKLLPIFEELQEECAYWSTTAGCHEMFFPYNCGERWQPVFKALAKYNRYFTLEEFRVFVLLIVQDGFEAEGQKAYDIVRTLYGLSQNGQGRRTNAYPEANGELSKIKVRKGFDGEFEHTTVWLHLPDGEMVARMFGSKSCNIKFLGEIFAGEANVHFHIERFAPKADVSLLL